MSPRRRSVAGWKVMPGKCETCPFRDEASREWREVRARIESELLSSLQLCHHPQLKGKRETHLCRGARDLQLTIMFRLGFIAAPTDEAWAAKCRELGIGPA